MATSFERNKHLQRPRKGDADRRRRMKVQKKRLLALGVTEEKLTRLNAVQIRNLLRRPAKVGQVLLRYG